MIIISTTHLHEMQAHGQRAYPEECCGALMGVIDPQDQRKITHQVLPLENESEENRHRRFKITAQDYMRLERQAKQEGVSLLGFYHTHPDHPAQPSETDLKAAWPVFSYLILSVQKGEPSTLNSLVLDTKTHCFIEEALHVND